MLGTFSGTMTFGAGQPGERTLTAVAGTDVYLARLSPDGALLFVKQVQSTGGKDAPRAVTVLPDGGVVITGACEGASTFGDDADPARNLSFPAGGGLDFFVAGYSAAGDLRFALSSGSALDDGGTSLAAYLDGSFLVGGFASDPAKKNELLFARILPGASGTQLRTAFAEQFGGTGDDQVTAVATFPDGTAVVAGFFEEAIAFGNGFLLSRGGRDGFVERIDPEGKPIHGYHIAGIGRDEVTGLATFPDGSFVVTGTFQGAADVAGLSPQVTLTARGGPDDFDGFLLHVSARDDIDFAERLGGGAVASEDDGSGVITPIPLDGARAVAALCDGSAIVTGFFSGAATFGSGPGTVELTSAGGKDAFIARYDSLGKLQHAASAGGSLADDAASVAVIEDGTALVGGSFSGRTTLGGGEAGEISLSSSGTRDAFLARYEPVNYRLLDVRPEGLAFASVPGADIDAKGEAASISASQDGGAWVTGAFSGDIVFREASGFEPPVLLHSPGHLDIFNIHVLPDGTVDVAHQAGDPNGDDTGLGVVALPDGGALVTGSITGQGLVDGTTPVPVAGETDMFIMRLRRDGSVVYARSGGGQAKDAGKAIALVPGSDDFLVTGFVDSDFDLDFAGTQVGIHLARRNQNREVFVARYSGDGEPRFVLLAGGAGDDEGAGIASDSEQGIWVTGRLVTVLPNILIDNRNQAATMLVVENRGVDAFLFHFDSVGNLARAKLLGGPGTDEGTAVASTTGGEVLVTGRFSGAAAFGDPGAGGVTLTSAGQQDAFLARFRADASLVFARRAGGMAIDEALGVAALPDGSALVTGFFNLTASFGDGIAQTVLTASANPRLTAAQDVFLARFDSAGALVFARNAGGGGLDRGRGIAALADGSAYVAGEMGTGTVALRRGPPIVFGIGDSHQITVDDFASGKEMFFAKYFPYGK